MKITIFPNPRKSIPTEHMLLNTSSCKKQLDSRCPRSSLIQEFFQTNEGSILIRPGLGLHADMILEVCLARQVGGLFLVYIGMNLLRG